MSRRKKRRYEDETREVLTSLTVPLRSQSDTSGRRTSARAYQLNLVEDYRRLDAEPTRLPKLFSGVTASVDVDSTPRTGARKNRVPTQIAFTAPRETIQCVRRQRRKEVMFAKNKAGKGKGRQRRPRRSRWSDIKC